MLNSRAAVVQLESITIFVDEQAEFISTVFALGVGAWVANFHGYEGNVSTSIDSMKAQPSPRSGIICHAFIESMLVETLPSYPWKLSTHEPTPRAKTVLMNSACSAWAESAYLHGDIKLSFYRCAPVPV